MSEVDSEFQGLIERHEMGFAYKRITEQLGPSPQLLAFLNYDNVTSESLGLESLNIIDQHEVALTQIGESEASFHIATEGFFSGLKSMLSGIHNRLFGKKAPPPPPINLSDLMTGKLVLKEHNAPVVSYADFQKLIVIANNVHKDVDKLVSFVPASHDMDTWQAFYDKHIKNRQTSQLDKVIFNIKLNRTAYNKIEGNKVPFARSGWTTTTFRAALVALAKNVHDYDQMREKIEHVCSDIYDTAISNLEAEVNPAAPLRKAIVVPPVTHHRKLKEPQLGIWWNALAAQEGQTQASTINAAELIALTMCRKSEVLNATWGDIEGLDGDEPVFVIPAERMKMRRKHIIPLPKQAVAILQAQAAIQQAAGRDLGNDEYIFTTLQSPKKPINISTLNALFNRIASVEGCEFVRNADGKSDFSPHGLRGTATTILRERGYARDLVELLLAHSERGVHAAYNAAEQLPARRAALAFYADLIDALAAAARGDNVVVLERRAA
ncbi:MAG: hypothetical protein EOO77_12885 [Oxalobacteraceae bacterium]|nr:MAG: hypothetical protein EOO77_12885 [Oxalobacteraceae bacterium]